MISILHARAGIPRFTRLLRTGEPAKIVAFGTSLTLGNAYLDRLPRALDAAYPAARCTLINRGRNGYMTMAGAFRVAEDVLPHAPDLALIEFAHNDVTEVLVEYIASALEGMLAQIRGSYPNCEFAFVYLALPGTAEAGPTAAMSVYEAVANACGIPSFDLATYSEALVRAGSAVWYGDLERALTVDGIHHAPAASALLGEPFAAGFLQLLDAGGDGPHILPPRASALLTVSRIRAADRLSSGVWEVRALAPTELRGAGIDEEGVAEAREAGATVRVAFTGSNAFAWVSGAGVFGVRILETNERFRIGVDAVAKWFWCSLMETHAAGHYTLEIVALDAGLLIGDICFSGTFE